LGGLPQTKEKRTEKRGLVSVTTASGGWGKEEKCGLTGGKNAPGGTPDGFFLFMMDGGLVGPGEAHTLLDD